MSNGYPREEAGQRVILGMAPAKYDEVVCTYDSNNNLLTATYWYSNSAISKITCTYDSNGNLLTASVGAA